MPYLRAIWDSPLSPQPLLWYADWLEAIGLSGAAAYYRRKAGDVANGRAEPEYPDHGWLDEDWD
jgi:uncharacterized protein (TIGR02996 family)